MCGGGREGGREGGYRGVIDFCLVYCRREQANIMKKEHEEKEAELVRREGRRG